MSNWRREKLDPIKFLTENWPGIDVSHIEYDPEFKRGDREYWIVRGGGHDGTQIFTWRMLRDAVAPLALQQSCLKSKILENDPGLIGMRYRIGPMQLSTVYGMVDLKCGRYPGQRERVRIPVICEKVYAND